mgnify:CR=1 FL=1
MDFKCDELISEKTDADSRALTVDPETTLTMDSYLTACTGIDALTHAIEAYVSTASSPIVDVHALAAIKLIWNNIEQAVSMPSYMPARENMLLGSLQAGLAFSNASLGAVHALAHALGGFLDLPHGECNALLLEHVVRFNISKASDRYKQIGEAIGLEMTGITERQRASVAHQPQWHRVWPRQPGRCRWPCRIDDEHHQCRL